jgi:hypothetical protein
MSVYNMFTGTLISVGNAGFRHKSLSYYCGVFRMMIRGMPQLRTFKNRAGVAGFES